MALAQTALVTALVISPTTPRAPREFAGEQDNVYQAQVSNVAPIKAFVAHRGITHESRADHAHYVASWLTLLKAEKAILPPPHREDERFRPRVVSIQ